MNKWKNNFANFMRGRYGMDELGRTESIAALVVLIVSMVLSIFSRKAPTIAIVVMLLEVLWIGLFIHMYFRVFSRNASKRYQENQKFLSLRYKFVVKKDKYKKEWNQRGTYRFFSCPTCKQRVRVPKGKGKIKITCPKCRAEFIKRT